MKPPRPFSALPAVISYKASPKAISRRTSYILIRLEFLLYPQVIPDYFNRRGFGPPQGFTPASTCSWIGHQVSGLCHATFRSFQTRFRFGSVSVTLNLATQHNSPARSTKSTTLHACGALSACKHTVSGSISLPSWGSFHLSLTVLFSIGHMVVFSLRRWSSFLPSRFLVSRRTLDTLRLHNDFVYRTFTFFGLAFQLFSTILVSCLIRVLTPIVFLRLVWAVPLSLATTHRIVFTFFSFGCLDVSVPRVPLLQLLIHCKILQHYLQCVSAFGYLRLFAHLQLPVAFRSLSRPSSAPYTKASPVCSL